MNNIFKSTTNTITMVVVIGTFLMVMYAMVMGIQEVNTVVFGAWTTLIGWVVGAKSSKSKTKEPQENRKSTDVNIEDLQKLL